MGFELFQESRFVVKNCFTRENCCKTYPAGSQMFAAPYRRQVFGPALLRIKYFLSHVYM